VPSPLPQLQTIISVGSQIVYRLGESIEHTPRKYRMHPPRDPERWAQICVGIIRHYNEGWANGFQPRIRYWEIGNEPDIGPAMWTGTEKHFFQLFETAAKLIKTNFPNVKVDGPALGGTGDFVNGQFQPAPFFTCFLAHCRANEVLLDFLSWHRYAADTWDLPRRARAMWQVLDAHGFTNTVSHLNAFCWT
jgi:xylan 1,4-beta-xylosidase